MTTNDTTVAKIDTFSIKPITVIAASAGTGKTYRLSHEYLEGLSAAKQNDSSIIATTFTNKAADELLERIRRLLLEQGKWLEAQAVLSGYLGTVNSLCGRFLSEHAIDAGLSPDLTIIGEERLQAVFAIAIDSVIHEFAAEMNGPTLRLQLDNWRERVKQVIDHARDNNIDASELEGFAQQSWESLRNLLPISDQESASTFDRVMAEQIDSVLAQLPGKDDVTVSTRQVIDKLTDVSIKIKSGAHIVWQSWANMTRFEVGKSSREIIKPLIDAAHLYAQHPRLHEDIKTVIFGVFRCAAAAMKTYDDYKREHGLIDFVDQMLLTLKLLENPEVRESLQSRAHLLLVDEFQDTSPMQLAIFLELAKLVDYSVWVGDEKQSIFGFRGSDPELMRQAIEHLVTTTGGTKDVLGRSYRSRPKLVDFTNSLFSKCAQLSSITSSSSIIDEVDRPELDEQNDALHVWWLRGKRQEQSHICLAEGIAEVLSNPQKWQILDRHTKELRPISGSDIAILCTRNDTRIEVAKALVARGLTVATERDSLLDTPECVLACAALRIVVDKSDTLAIAEMANLLSPSSGKWLEVLLDRDSDDLTELSHPELAKTKNCLAHLENIRHGCLDRTPSEILESAINSDGIMETVVAWGNIRQRLANLDSLRGIATAYEELCRSSRTPATLAGLIVHLYKFVEKGGNQPANPDENGIHIITYHKSKGLEWPMVVLYDLDRSIPGNPFGVTVESTGKEIDPMSPLSGRAIRYWPWPFGKTRAKIALNDQAMKTQAGKTAAKRKSSEDVRLLYVGMTRARDYLVFGCRLFGFGPKWLQCLTDKEYNLSLLRLSDQGVAYKGELIDGDPTSIAQYTPIEEPSGQRLSVNSETLNYAPIPIKIEERVIHPPYFLNPSTASEADFILERGVAPETFVIGERIPLRGTPDMLTVGDCVHAFLSVDTAGSDARRRVELASQVVAGFGIDHVDIEALPVMTDRLVKFLQEKYPGAVLAHEMPVQGRLQNRRVKGTIDLLAKTSDGYIIIDHKTFPGKFEEWESKALSHAPQLALYRYMVEQSTRTPVIAQYIHMPVVGAMIKLDFKLANLSGS
jgi:ATP-dependent exoDNAse (exonuclease V) beta subunit